MVLYILSFGPVYACMTIGGTFQRHSDSSRRVLDEFYAPIHWCASKSVTIEKAWRGYISASHRARIALFGRARAEGDIEY